MPVRADTVQASVRRLQEKREVLPFAHQGHPSRAAGHGGCFPAPALRVGLGQAGELVFDSPEEPFVVLGGLGLAAFVVAIWGLRPLASGRLGRTGWRIMAVGVVFLGLFASQAVVTVAVTGDVPDNFILLGLGFLLLFVGHLVIAPGLRPTLGRFWVLPLVAAGGIVVAITLDVDPIHDVGLFVFEGAWIAIGLVLLVGKESVVATGIAFDQS